MGVRPTKYIGDVTITGNLTVGGAEVVDNEFVDDVLFATDKELQFRAATNRVFSNAVDELTVEAPTINVTGDVVTSGAVSAGGLLTLLGAISNLLLAATARTATATGATTGTIAAKTGWVDVTCDDAAKIIILPAPVPATILFIQVGATGFELRSSDPETIGINGGTGADAESAIGANTLVVMICQSATSWKGLQLGSDGTLAKVEAAA